MTDPHTPADPGPVDPDVELASARLDREVAPDERARADEAGVQAHAATLSSVVDRVRDVPQAPPGLLDDHVARAMQDFDDQGTVVALGTRSPWWQRIPLGAVAAALVFVALAGAAGLASRADDDDSADTATAALDSADEAGDSGATSGGDFGATADGGGEAMEESTQLDSGAGRTADVVAAYDSYDLLAEDLRAELAGPALEREDPAATAAPSAGEETTADDAADDPCDEIGLLGLDPAAVVLVRTVLVGPDQVTVVVHDAADGRRLAAVDETCTIVVDRLL